MYARSTSGGDASEPIIRLKVNNEKFQGVLDNEHHIHLFPAKGRDSVMFCKSNFSCLGCHTCAIYLILQFQLISHITNSRLTFGLLTTSY